MTQNVALRVAWLQAVARGQGYQLEPCGLPAQLCGRGLHSAMQTESSVVPTEEDTGQNREDEAGAHTFSRWKPLFQDEQARLG